MKRALLLGALALTACDSVYDCRAIDGDTLDCGGERVRLIGIDAPEADTRDGPYARQVLSLIVLEPVTIERRGEDRYGRTLAHVYGADENVACTLMLAGAARYVERWDNLPRGQVAMECRL